MTENFQNRNQQEETQHQWDIFEEPPEVSDNDPSNGKDKWKNVEKVAKLFSYIVAFLIVLGGSVISKGTLLFMTAQLSNKPKPYYKDVLVKNEELVVILTQEEKVAWTWILAFVYFVPQLATFLRSSRILLFKTWYMPSLLEFGVVFISESLSAIGNAILVLCVLPKLDSVKGCVVMSCLSLGPAILSFYSTIMANSDQKKTRGFFKTMSLELLNVILQGIGLILLTLLQDGPIKWWLLVSAILISIGWCENYCNGRIIMNTRIKSDKILPNSRSFSYTFVSLWKCILFLGMMNLIEWYQHGKANHLFSAFIPAFSDHDIIIKNVTSLNDNYELIKNQYLTPVWVLIINVVASYFSYIFGKFACKINIQRISYAIPLYLSGPVTVVGLVSMCAVYTNHKCEYSNIIPSYLFFNSPFPYEWDDLWLLITMLLLFMSFVILTRHLWNPTKENLQSTERLYVRPFYEPYLIDQDLGMNRRRLREINSQKKDEETFTRNSDDIVPKLYVCGTMWHETKEEMLTFLKSVMVLDEDHCCRRLTRNYLHFSTTDYYELETHIVFDDAFTGNPHSGQQQLNDFVSDLINSVHDAASIVHKIDIALKEPVKYHTPYGGRLEWILPGKTKLVAHLKDNDKIRPKKRWSQVMYLYYILGHRIAERDDLDNKQKEIILENTYILAVDGDMHFKPQAIRMLLESMKRDDTLAAACGRVHPVGNGIFAWYQKFEYAISHWMYKASESIIGCVLCCPGCFTIFRASALTSVLKKLTTKSTKAVHFIKFDNGEDRWISTLLVLSGYKVGYVASSDAYTNCPEGFRELYNQRRRWIPSTTANILDLLSKTHTVRKVNDNVSMLYMIYQAIFNVLTLIGPAFVFWMTINACAFVFQTNMWLSLLFNSIVVICYIAICAYVTSERVQVHVALILCGIYTPIMTCFIIGSLIEVISTDFSSLWSLFSCFFLIQVVTVALCHPREIYYLKYLIFYFTMMPTMHMILFIYSIFNMHKISWGTREVNRSIPTNVTSATSWTENNSLKYGNVQNISDTENMFWTKLLDKYLHPLNNIKERNAITEDLKRFRHKVIATLFILNLMFISIAVLLTSKNVTVKWPSSVTDGTAVDNFEIELVNAILILVVSCLFLIQVVAICIHRFGTFSQIMSNTNLFSDKDQIHADPVQLIRKLQQTSNTSFSRDPKGTSDLEKAFLNAIGNGNNDVIWHNNNNRTHNNADNMYTNYGFNQNV